MKKYLLLATVLVATLAIASCGNFAATSQNQTAVESTDQDMDTGTVVAANQSFSYKDYTQVLNTYVDDAGLIDYQGLQANREQLDKFNQSLAAVSPETYAAWSEPEQIAFWMNAYNSLTLQSIIDQDPLPESIRDISGVWNRRKFSIAGESQTLDNIEHDILRQDFDEPRLHVALVCAAISCPPLRNEPYLPEKLDAQLNDQVAKFIVSPHGFKLDRQQNKVYLSSIFKWYGKDWVDTYGVKDQFAGNSKQRAVINFLSQYLNPEERRYLETESYKVDHLDYDWSLNQQKK